MVTSDTLNGGISFGEYDPGGRDGLNQRLVDNLLFDVVTLEHGLTPEERLYILLNSGRIESVHRRWLADTYLAAGCLTEASAIYEESGDYRKCGDLALASGDFAAALALYWNPACDERDKKFRVGPDFDRIMSIAFMRRDWCGFIDVFRAADLDPLDRRRVVFSGAARSASPWVRRLAIAAVQSGMKDDHQLAADACRALLLTADDWNQMIDWAAARTDADLAREDVKLMQNVAGSRSATPKEAAARGANDRSRSLLAWIMETPRGLERASRDITTWIASGDRSALDRAVSWIAACVFYKLARTVLFELTNRSNRFDGPVERICALYRAHPHLMRFGLGHYLALKVQFNIPFTGDDLLNAVYQAMAWPTREFEPQSDNDISFDRLKSCEAWAEVRLGEWCQSHEGRAVLERVGAALIKGDTSYTHDIRREESWVSAMDAAIAWLGNRWSEEIGVAVWKTEMQVFQFLKKVFRGKRVVQHDSPHWLAPQHLDIHVPDLRLAVEYMGLQHYEPVEVFGGEDAFKRTVERDRRKVELCQAAGVTLEHIRYDDDITKKINEIASRHGGALIRKI